MSVYYSVAVSTLTLNRRFKASNLPPLYLVCPFSMTNAVHVVAM